MHPGDQGKQHFLIQVDLSHSTVLSTNMGYVCTCFKAFNVEVDKICAIVPAFMLVVHIPVTLLGNLGYFESVFVFYFL